MNDAPGAALDSQIRELGASVIDRTDRLSVGISRNNREIEVLQSKTVRLAIGMMIQTCALVIIAGARLLW
ncbi:MAG: hypothetical protein WBF43_12140 [Methylocella sp.]